MPTPALKSLAKKAGASLDRVEKLWDKAKDIAKKEGFEEGTDDFFAFTMGTLKNMLGLNKDSKNERYLTKSEILIYSFVD